VPGSSTYDVVGFRKKKGALGTAFPSSVACSLPIPHSCSQSARPHVSRFLGNPTQPCRLCLPKVAPDGDDLAPVLDEAGEDRLGHGCSGHEWLALARRKGRAGRCAASGAVPRRLLRRLLCVVVLVPMWPRSRCVAMTSQTVTKVCLPPNEATPSEVNPAPSRLPHAALRCYFT